MDKTAAKRQRTRRAKLKLDGLRLVRIPLGRDTLAALDRLKASHGTRQAAIEHAISIASHTERTVSTATDRTIVGTYMGADGSPHYIRTLT